MNRKQHESNTRYAVRMWLLLVALPCLAMAAIAIVAEQAEAATVNYEPEAPHCIGVTAVAGQPGGIRCTDERKCYAVLHALGSKPVQVPCPGEGEASAPGVVSPPAVATPQPQTPTPNPRAYPPPRVVPHPVDHRCFHASEWGPAPDAIRPCVRIVGNSPEGGAVRFVVKDADGVVRYSGYVNTRFRKIIHVHIVALYEDGSFTWKARSQDGRTTTASVGNLQD